MTCDVTVVILTYNEERHISRAIESVRPFARRVLVVDSFSTDATLAIAREAGAAVVQRAFLTQADQFNWALDTQPIATGWIMRLDADEVIEPDLAAAIIRRLPDLPADVVGIALQRKHIFMDRWIRHGGRYPLTLLRLWRRGAGRVEDRWMDEHVVTSGGRTIVLEGGFADHNLHDLTFFTAKHNSYATREAIDVVLRRHGLAKEENTDGQAPPRQAHLKRWIKEHVFNRLPFWMSASGYFLFRYVGQLGFLDGRPGLIYHVLQGFWYRFLAGAKVAELEALLRDATCDDDRRRRISVATGYRLPTGTEPAAAPCPVVKESV